jgi:hypothetical protein
MHLLLALGGQKDTVLVNVEEGFVWPKSGLTGENFFMNLNFDTLKVMQYVNYVSSCIQFVKEVLTSLGEISTCVMYRV